MLRGASGSAATAGATPAGRSIRRAERSTTSPASGRPRSGRRTTTRSGSTRPALARADGDLDGPRRRRRARRARRADRRAARGVRLAVPRHATSTVTDDEWVDATREGLQRRERARRRRGPRQGRLARRARRSSARIHEPDGLTLRVWQSLPADTAAASSPRSALRSRHRRRLPPPRLPEGVHGRHARLADRAGCSTAPASRSRAGEELAEIVRAARAAGWPVAVHAIGDRANREALDAFEATRDAWQPRGLRQRIEHAQCLDAGGPAALRASSASPCSVQFSHAPSDRDLAERFWGDRLDGDYAFRSLLDSGAVVANGSDAPIEELDPLAGIARRRAPHDRRARRRGARERARDVEQALHATDRRAGLARRRRAPAREARCPATSPTSSCSTATRSTCPPDELRRGAGRRDDGRRPLGAQPAALGLSRQAPGRVPACAPPPPWSPRWSRARSSPAPPREQARRVRE